MSRTIQAVLDEATRKKIRRIAAVQNKSLSMVAGAYIQKGLQQDAKVLESIDAFEQQLQADGLTEGPQYERRVAMFIKSFFPKQRAG